MRSFTITRYLSTFCLLSRGNQLNPLVFTRIFVVLTLRNRSSNRSAYQAAAFARAPVFFLLTILTLTSCCDSDSIPKYTRWLTSSVAKERNEGALQLARCGEKAAGTVPRLSEMLYDDNAGVQSSAAYALREIDTPAARKAIRAAEESRRRK